MAIPDAHGRAAWRPFVPILAVQFIGTLGFSVALPFLVFVVTDFGGAAWTYGLVGATYSACQLVGAPVLGRLSDRVGRRHVLVVSQGGTLLAWLLFLVALALPRDSLVSLGGASITLPLLLLFGLRALDGLTGGNISVANAYVADRTVDTPELRQRAFGWMGMAASLGFAIGPALAGLLGTTSWGYAAPVAAAALISAVAMALCLRLPEPERSCPDGPPEQPALTRVMGQEHRRCDRPHRPAPRHVLRRPEVAAVLVATFLLFLAFNLFYAVFPIHAERELDWTAGTLGALFMLMAACMILAEGPLLGAASKRLPPALLFLVGVLGLMAAFALFALPTDPLIFAGAILFALGNGLSWPTFQARVADIAGPQEQGAVQGAATSAGSLASIIGLVAGGLLYTVLQTRLFVIGAVLLAFVAAGTRIWFGPGRKRRV